MQTTLKQEIAVAGQTEPLRQHVKQALANYFGNLGGHDPVDLYQMVLEEIEIPLLEAIMVFTSGNQSKAAILLGLSRGTLRKKLKQYNMLG